MSKRKRAAVWVVVLSIILGAVIWHVVQWHSTGMYLNMSSWVETDKAYITVLYNLGLMVIMIIGLFITALRYRRGHHIPTWAESLVAKEE